MGRSNSERRQACHRAQELGERALGRGRRKCRRRLEVVVALVALPRLPGSALF